MEKNTNPIKSTAKRIKDLDFSKEVIIDRLVTNRENANHHYKQLKKAYPTLSEQDIWHKLNNTILKENLLSHALNIAFRSYEFDIKDSDIDRILEATRQNNPEYKNVSDENFKRIIKQNLMKDLVLSDLAKLWKIQASDDEVKATYIRMYVAGEGKKSVHEYLKNDYIVFQTKMLIIKQKTIDTLINHLKFKMDWKTINERVKQNHNNLKNKK